MGAFPAANVCVAPHSLHAASPDMIRAAADFAREFDCAMHVHVAEAAYEGERTLAQFGATPIALLAKLNALDEHTVAIHAIHITEEEKDAIAQAGARVVHNPMTNQYLGDGICDVEGLLARGVTIGLGTDADVKPSLIDEMREASLLQKIARSDGSALGAPIAFALGTSMGAKALGVVAGDLVRRMRRRLRGARRQASGSVVASAQRAGLSRRRCVGSGDLRRRPARLYGRRVPPRAQGVGRDRRGREALALNSLRLEDS